MSLKYGQHENATQEGERVKRSSYECVINSSKAECCQLYKSGKSFYETQGRHGPTVGERRRGEQETKVE